MQWLRRITQGIEAEDCIFVVGLVMVGVGLAMIYPPAALIVPGGALAFVAAFGRWGT